VQFDHDSDAQLEVPPPPSPPPPRAWRVESVRPAVAAADSPRVNPFQ
jgi:hypothetical protein